MSIEVALWIAIIATLIGVAVNEALNCIPYICRKLIICKGRRIPAPYRMLTLDTIFADLETMNSNLGKLILTLGFMFYQSWDENYPDLEDDKDEVQD